MLIFIWSVSRYGNYRVRNKFLCNIQHYIQNWKFWNSLFYMDILQTKTKVLRHIYVCTCSYTFLYEINSLRQENNKIHVNDIKTLSV
jgi:hypothetical protein